MNRLLFGELGKETGARQGGAFTGCGREPQEELLSGDCRVLTTIEHTRMPPFFTSLDFASNQFTKSFIACFSFSSAWPVNEYSGLGDTSPCSLLNSPAHTAKSTVSAGKTFSVNPAKENNVSISGEGDDDSFSILRYEEAWDARLDWRARVSKSGLTW